VESDRIDVAVVGARVAGSALAARLAAAGLSVAVFDRATPQQPTLSTHILHGTEDLRAEGVYADLLAAGVPELREVRVRIEDVELPLRHHDAPGLCPPREILDQLLLDRAVAAGAKTYLGTPVVGLLTGDGRVRGVAVQAPDGSVSEVRARLVVGADGRNSSVARWVGARQYLASRSERALVWRYFRGKTLPPVLHWHRRGEHIVSILPTGPAEFLLIAQPPDRQHADLTDPAPDTLVRHAERVSPPIAELARGAEPAGPPRRIVRYPCYFRTPHGPGWALTGDAGHGKDATLGQGINDALRNARLLAEALVTAWPGPAALDESLRRWARDRDRMELANYWYGQDIGRAAPVTAMERALLLGIRRSPAASRRLDDLMADRLAADRLLTLGRLVGAGARRVRAGEAPWTVAGDAGGLVRLAWRRKRAAARQDPTAPALR
jgi:2-polyprenyl-6-methoxyphenol hydroxylase-like FAD-dependent oxidoreductase